MHPAMQPLMYNTLFSLRKPGYHLCIYRVTDSCLNVALFALLPIFT